MDLRVKKTLRSLLDSFEELLKSYKYEEITVSMLCQSAETRRTTFYKHFSDKDSFFKYYLTQKRAKLEEICGFSTPDLEICVYHVHMLDSLTTFMLDNERLVNNVIKSSQSSTILDFVAEVIADNVIVAFEATQTQRETKEFEGEYIGACVSGATIQMIKYWWAKGHKPKERLKLVQVSASLLETLKK